MAVISTLIFCGVAIAHLAVFSRADYDKYDSDYFLVYDDIDKGKYPRDQMIVQSISAEEDSFYGGKSPIYERQNEIVNPNCTFMLMDKENHNGHYDFFLADAAIEYKAEIWNRLSIRNCIWSMMRIS